MPKIRVMHWKSRLSAIIGVFFLKKTIMHWKSRLSAIIGVFFFKKKQSAQSVILKTNLNQLIGVLANFYDYLH